MKALLKVVSIVASKTFKKMNLAKKNKSVN